MHKIELAKQYFYEGLSFLDKAEFSLAENRFKLSLEFMPDRPSTLTNLSVVLLKQKKYFEAKLAAEKAILLEDTNTQAFLNLGLIYKSLNEYFLAINSFNMALQLQSDNFEAWSIKADLLQATGRFEEAITHYDKAISLKPDYAEAWSNKGAALNQLRRFEEAITHYDKAISLKPDYAEAWSNKGAALNQLRRFEEAITHYDKAISLKPDYAEAWSNKADAFQFIGMHSQSAECYQMALELDQEGAFLLGRAHHQKMLNCDWNSYKSTTDLIFKQIKQQRKVAEPFGFQGICVSEELIKICAETFSSYKFPAQKVLHESFTTKSNKIRIGYLCGEFREQATSILLARIWELHDKSKFEIFAFDNGWNDGSYYRRRINEAFTEIISISHLSDLEAAHVIARKEIDILVNLNGFFGNYRQGVFAYKPAPIQVNYLGFPGTLGASYMDYIIADKIVIPEESKQHYSEKIVYLPNSYQANDDQRRISTRNISRAEFGLPDGGFVFSCFNNTYKITPETFNLWCRILKRVKGSVLWLLVDNSIAKLNLVKEAADRGIESSRLVFAGRLPPSDHLLRHHLADLFLDTLPYNAHTTCSDALWAGLPVLALMGNTFPGRVSSSLLAAIGLSELVVSNEIEYENLAVYIAENPAVLAAIKNKLQINLLSKPLFDSARFTRNIESAYMSMMERKIQGLEPDHIEISDTSSL